MRTRLLTCALAALTAAGPLYLLATGRTSIRTSSDEGATPQSLAAAVLPLLAGVLIAWLVPLRTPAPLPARRPDGETWTLVALAVAFPVLIGTLPIGYGYPLVKLALFGGGALLVALIGRRRTPFAPLERPRGRASLWPVPAIAAWALLEYASPLRQPPLDPADYPDLVSLTVIALITLVTASVLEELFYRVALQTRLEARFGRLPGLLMTSLLFAGMHLPTHHPFGSPLPDVAAAIAFQGVMGLFVGTLWTRFRSKTAIIAVHAATNAVALIPLYLS